MHSLFNVSKGGVRLCFNRVENRPIFYALMRHVDFLGRKGCWRAALEFQKLLFSFDPESDPVCATLGLDFLAMKAGEFAWFIEFYNEFREIKGLDLMPNAVYSLAMATWEIETLNGDTHDKSEELLRNAVIMCMLILT
jgi:Transcriptional repressor TCF25